MLRTVMVAALASTAGLAQAQTNIYELDAETREIAQSLGRTALESDLAYEITESLSTEIGPRLAGTPQEARARDWAVEMFERLDFQNVRIEEFELDLWTRGRSVYEEVAITAPYPQPVYAISLGGAAATPLSGGMGSGFGLSGASSPRCGWVGRKPSVARCPPRCGANSRKSSSAASCPRRSPPSRSSVPSGCTTIASGASPSRSAR